ncbi:hypothetical protein BGW37DRAFT_424950 [Umbelopsis sp. PMI_123]|nr:hypothetical protein BGW37DRAFT_424950 [Umbelopsis sp. PMI_123]
MFPKPPPILQQSLHAIADHPQNYFADVCFRYDNGQVWAHKAIIKTRVPRDFQTKFLQPALEGIQHVDLQDYIPMDMLQRIIRFWYTASFVETVPPGPAVESEEAAAIRALVLELESKIGIKLLPLVEQGVTDDYQQWLNDISRMRKDHINVDIVITIDSTANTPLENVAVPAIAVAGADTTSYPVHRFILAAQCPYFNALFNSKFKEASSSTVHLPRELFNSASLDCILQYYYSSNLVIPTAPIRKSATAAVARLNQKKFALRLLQKVFRGADYLGQTISICALALHEIAQICDQFKCTCADCQLLLPSVLSFSDKVVSSVPKLRPTILRLYSDPIQGIAKLWPQKPFALLVNSLGIVTEDTGSNSFLVQKEESASALVRDISSQTLSRISKHSAIQSFHAMHLCLSQLRASDPFPTWSNATLNLLNPIIHHTALLVAMNFDYFCVEYPILLSCVDGIGFGFSCDFLEFLLNRVLDEGMQDVNAGILYQGIVRDLIGRQEVVKNIAVGEVLDASRLKCVAYLKRRWLAVKAQNGFKDLDKEVLRTMAEDIGVPYRTLSKPMDSDFMNLFSFKPYSKSSKNVQRSLSSDASAQVQTYKSQPLTIPTIRQPQAMLDLLSQETESRQKRQAARYGPPSSHGSFSSLTDVLLPIESTSTESSNDDTPAAPRQSRLKFALPETPVRARSPNRSRSATRSHSPNRQPAALRYSRPRKSRSNRWSLSGGGSDTSDDDESTYLPITIGARAELLRRPLPTQGYVRYLGKLVGQDGTWVGVELDSRVGKNDGSVDGQRYFQTDSQRGIFVREDDLVVLASPHTSSQ